MAKTTVRIPLDVPPGLREYFLDRVKRVDHTLGLNPALRFLMTSICEMGNEIFADYLEMGKKYEQKLIQGEIKTYRDVYPRGPEDRDEIISVLKESVKEMEKQIRETKEFLNKVEKEESTE